jgi:hypothetical protein
MVRTELCSNAGRAMLLPNLQAILMLEKKVIAFYCLDKPTVEKLI